MILTYSSTSVELRDPQPREAWGYDIGGRLTRNRNGLPLIVIDGPKYLLLTMELLLDACDLQDQELRAFLDAANGQYGEASIFGVTYTSYIQSDMVPYAARLGFIQTDLQLFLTPIATGYISINGLQVTINGELVRI